MTSQANRLLILFAILTVFGQTLFFSFLVYDDPLNITKNMAVVSPSIQQWISFWKSPYQHLYIPVSYTVWMAIGAFSKLLFGRLHPGLFHGANIALHCTNTLLVYAILKRILTITPFSEGNRTTTEMASLAGALLFALHPVQVEAVCWATGLKDLLGSFFFLTAVYFLIPPQQAQEENRPLTSTSLVFATVAYLAGLLSKPQVVIFPVFMYILLRFVLQRRPGPRFLLFTIIWLGIGLTIALFTRNAQPTPFHVSLLQRVRISIDAALFYFTKLLYPHPLMLDYGKSLAHELAQRFQWVYPSMAGATVIGLSFCKKFRVYLTCALLALICLTPVLGLIPFHFQRISIVADRYLYPSLVPISLAAAIFIKRHFSAATAAAVVLLICIYTILSLQYVSKWQDTEVLMRYTLTQNHESKTANQNLGVGLMRQGKMKQAIPFLQKALSLTPDDTSIHFDLALSYACIGDLQTANREKLLVMQQNPKLAGKLEHALSLVQHTCQDQ